MIQTKTKQKKKFWNEAFDFSESVDDHNGIILSMAKSNDYLITGSSDHSIKVMHFITHSLSKRLIVLHFFF